MADDRPIRTARQVPWTPELVLLDVGAIGQPRDQQLAAVTLALDEGRLPEQALPAVFEAFPELDPDVGDD